MKKIIVLMLTFILFFTVFNITPQLKIQIAKADAINVPGDYSTIQAAINNASPGDIIHVFNGIYEEIINIDVENLTLEGQDKENTIIIDSYWSGDAVEVSASNVKIKNFTISYAKENGIIAENINNVTIENCNIENNGAYGVYLVASSNTVSNCEIFENYYSGIKIGGSSYAEANNNAVISCEFYDNGYGGLQDDMISAVSISPINGIVTNTKIVDCFFYSSYAYDIYVKGNTVANNIFYHNDFLSKTVTENVYDSTNNNNFWYNATLEEGNFWIDYTEKYPDATSSNGVFWNTPYEISGGNNKDMYPLVDPIGLEPPVANANGPYTANKGVAIIFNASGSYDPDEDQENPYLFYEWDLGNGDTRYEETVSYTYLSTGTYNVTLTVEDYHGLTDTDTTTAVITGNTPPNLPTNPMPSDGSLDVLLNNDISWNCSDPNGDPLTFDVYFGTSSNPPLNISGYTSTIYDPGVMNPYTKYYWKIVAKDNDGASAEGPIWNFTTIYVNLPPKIPSTPKPSNESTGIGIDADLSWAGGDPNSNDTVTYDIYFGTNKSNLPLEGNTTKEFYELDRLEEYTTYYWRIEAKDNHGNTSIGPIWSFKTGASGGSGGGGGGGSPTPMPIANASASDNTGFVNIAVRFDASYSYHEDGEITNYTWDYGDSNFGYGKITNHIYEKVGTYTVKLKVTDDYDLSDTDTIQVIISEQNNPPTIPQIDGPKTGKQNIEYNFTVFSTDPDNDSIQYVFNWGDEQTNETDFVANGTMYTEKHKWISSGVYKISIYTVDSKNAESDSAETSILIDVIYCKNIGYLIDEDSNGTYNLFYSNQTSIKTPTEQQENGTYLINNDMDSDWDYIYNIQTGKLSLYSPKTEPGETETDNTIYYVIAIIVIIVLLLLFAILSKKPTKEKKTEKEQQEEQDKAKEKPTKEKSKKQTTKKKQTKTQKKKPATKKKGKKRK